jgi:hypothetical protein
LKLSGELFLPDIARESHFISATAYASLTFNNANEGELEARDVRRASGGGNLTLRRVSLPKGKL